MTGKEIIEELRKEKPNLQQQFGVEEIGVFGSYARGDMDEESDIDIIVSLKKADYSLLAGLYIYLENLFNRKIDLIRKGKHLTN
jgi:hypothetical protein